MEGHDGRIPQVSIYRIDAFMSLEIGSRTAIATDHSRRQAGVGAGSHRSSTLLGMCDRRSSSKCRLNVVCRGRPDD